MFGTSSFKATIEPTFECCRRLNDGFGARRVLHQDYAGRLHGSRLEVRSILTLWRKFPRPILRKMEVNGPVNF